MLYYSYNLYLDWYNWYYGITPKEEEPIVLKEVVTNTTTENTETTFTQATLNEAIIASINDPPPPIPKQVQFEIVKKIKNKAKKKGRR